MPLRVSGPHAATKSVTKAISTLNAGQEELITIPCRRATPSSQAIVNIPGLDSKLQIGNVDMSTAGSVKFYVFNRGGSSATGANYTVNITIV